MLPAFRVLAKFKFLRGSPLDIFGRSEERKEERALITDYEQQIAQLLLGLSESEPPVAKLELAVELAGLPFFIRGFGHVKTANIVIARRRGAGLLKQFNAEAHGNNQLKVVNIQEPEVIH